MRMFNIARNEWARLFMSKHGWLAITAFGLIWILFLIYVIRPAANYIANVDMGIIFELLLPKMDMAILKNWLTAEVGLYWFFALYLLPFFTMVSAADQIASDRSRGTLRFLVLRASRTEIFFGRFIGQYVIQLLAIFVTAATVIALIAIYNPDRVSSALSEIPIVMLNLALVLLPVAALMALASVLSRSARRATLWVIIGWIVAWFVLGYIQYSVGLPELLQWVLPGSQRSSLVMLRGSDTLSLAPIPLVQTIVLLVLGWIAMQRCEL